MSSSVEQIKARLNIVDVVQGYLRLQKAGVNLKANCPFHNEKTPSFFVSPSRDTWHCFGCNKGGDIFSFVMEIEGLEFPEALKLLADKAGVELEPIDPKYKNEKNRLSRLINEVKDFYEQELGKNPEVLNYLKDRGLQGETIKHFGIGFAPNGWRNLRDHLKNKNYSEQEIEKTGMLVRSERGVYDRFRNRIMFPVFNHAGQIVGFSGRIFGKEDETTGGKYINTPQTILYDKSKILYGFDRAKEEIRRKNSCILVEGQMDLIMSHQAGVKNAVAVSGTALTHDHLKIIKRLTDNIIMSFDRDEAGLGAAKRAIDMALENDFEIKTAVVASGKDPADTIKKNPKDWERAVSEAKNIFDFYLDAVENLEPIKKIKEIQETILPRIAVLTSEVKKAYWIKEIAGKLSIKEDSVWDELKKIKVEVGQETTVKNEKPGLRSRLELLKDRILGFIFWKKDTEDEELKKAMDYFIENYKLDLECPEIKNKMDKLIFETEVLYCDADCQKEFKNLVCEFERENVKAELLCLTEKIKELECKRAKGDLSTEETSMLGNYLNNFYDLTKKLA